MGKNISDTHTMHWEIYYIHPHWLYAMLSRRHPDAWPLQPFANKHIYI